MKWRTRSAGKTKGTVSAGQARCARLCSRSLTEQIDRDVQRDEAKQKGKEKRNYFKKRSP